MSERLALALQQHSTRLAERVIEDMYLDPFWNERFGARGRKHAVEDANYHVSYLVQALTAQDASLFTHYARWLQSVLVSRGMCSRHLDDSYAKLGRAIEHEIEAAGPALELLAVGRAALRYDAPLARTLQDDALARELEDGEPPVPSPSASLTYHLSYLADALAAARPDWFRAHARWLASFLPRHGASAAQLALQLARLRSGLAASELAPPELVAAVEPLIAEAEGAAS